jgi:hypothetical protein
MDIKANDKEQLRFFRARTTWFMDNAPDDLRLLKEQRKISMGQMIHEMKKRGYEFREE